MLEKAGALHAAGKLAEAETAYRDVLTQRPGDLDALLSLAQVLIDQSAPQKAAVLLQAEVELRPDNVELHLAYGTALAIQRKMAEAVQVFERATNLAPSLPRVHYCLGKALYEHGDVARAVESYRRALTGAPDAPDLNLLLGNALASLSCWEDAERHYRHALKIIPTFPAALVNLGNVLKSQRRLVEARDVYEEALRIQPQDADANYNLAKLLFLDGEVARAIDCLYQALAVRPDWPEAINNLAVALRVERGASASVEWCELALRKRPDFFDAHYNLGAAFEELREHEKALASYERALMLHPDSVDALEKLVSAKLSLCDWSDIEARMERLRAGIGKGSDVRPFPFLALPHVTRREQRTVAERYASEGTVGIELRHPRREPASGRNGHRLRIGYLSADFHEHATSYLMVEAFERHDRQRFETIAYSYGPHDSSPMRSRLASAFEKFVDVRHQSMSGIAATIKEHGTDILVDLKGYTEHHRAWVLAMRPAPLQVSYLGYPGTMGTDFIDYLIADRVVIPESHFEDYKEAIAWLPGCYQPNDSQRPVRSIPKRGACGLPESALVFCCLNQSYKINPLCFDIWCRVLARVPFSVLWLISTNPTTEENLRHEARRRGIASERIIFADRLPHSEHLARLQQADLYLDTTPYGAHTLASDALWAGVPVVTLQGDTFASRVASSLLMNLGLKELVANSPTEYEQLACALASDRGKLSSLRQALRVARSKATVFDGGRLARDLEALYGEMWRRHVAGMAPAHLS